MPLCIVAAKWFFDVGWVVVKNRDRNYIPEISFKYSKINGLDRMLFIDDMTDYMEGFNSKGVSILGTSLMVIDDEEVITSPNQGGKSDGEKIKEALGEKTPERAAQCVIDLELTGHTFVFDADRLFIVEACYDATGKYFYDMTEIKQNKTVARTNHGVHLDWAGYQYGIDKNQDLSRKSSESRMKQAEAVLKQAKTPQDIIDGLCAQPNKNTQMNALRTTTDRKMMRTTAQEMIIPIERTFFIRPVQVKMAIDFWKMNQEEPDMWLEVLSNRSLKSPPLEGMD
jgi:hypothetical protein